MIPETLVIVGGVVAATYAHAFAARRRHETRTRVLEVMAASVRRELPLAQGLAHVAQEFGGKPGRAVLAVAAELEGGAPVGDALSVACPWLLPRTMVASIQACDRTPAALAGVLRAATQQTYGTLAASHRLWLAVIYPTLVLLGAAFVWFGLGAIMATTAAAPAGMNLPIPEVICWTLAAVLLVWLLMRFHASIRRIPSLARLGDLVSLDVPPLRRTVRLGASEPTLRTMAALAAAGTPLGDVLEQAAPTSGNRAMARNVAAAGDMVRSGAPPEEVWEVTSFPSFVQARLALACRQEPAVFASALTDLADACAARYAARLETLRRWIHPAAIAVAASVVACEFLFVMRWLDDMRNQAMLW